MSASSELKRSRSFTQPPVQETRIHEVDKDGFAIPFPVVRTAQAANSAKRRWIKETPPPKLIPFSSGLSRYEYIQALLASRQPSTATRPQEKHSRQETPRTLLLGKPVSTETENPTKKLKPSINSDAQKTNDEWASKIINILPINTPL